MSDLIDRQAALDAIMGQPPEPHYPSWYAAQIEKIPAAQPDHVADISKKAEGDCISRKMAIDALAKQMPRSYTPDGSHPADEEIYKAQEIYVDCIESIEILPAVQPEIIRCKDCKHRRVENMVWTCPFGLPGGENFFCGYGTEPYMKEGDA